MPAYKGIFVSDPVSFTASLGTESVTVVFDRAKQTLRRDRDLARASKDGDIDAMVSELMQVLVSWDVVDEAGAPVPLTAEVLLDLPGSVLTQLLTLMGEAGQPSSAEGEVSGGRSSGSPPDTSTASTPPPPARLPTPLNGAEPSPSPVLSTSPSQT